MAACDNLYGNAEEWEQLRQFLENNKPQYLHYMNEKPIDDAVVRICYIASIQKWLLKFCKYEWVQERLNDNFDIQRVILGKAHHEKS